MKSPASPHPQPLFLKAKKGNSVGRGDDAASIARMQARVKRPTSTRDASLVMEQRITGRKRPTSPARRRRADRRSWGTGAGTRVQRSGGVDCGGGERVKWNANSDEERFADRPTRSYNRPDIESARPIVKCSGTFTEDLVLGWLSIPIGTYSMTQLEDLKPNAAVRGISPDSLVTVVNVQWFGSEALELTYKTPAGKVANVLLYRHDEPHLEVVEQGRPWSLDGDGRLFPSRLRSTSHPSGPLLRSRAGSPHLCCRTTPPSDHSRLRNDAAAPAACVSCWPTIRAPARRSWPGC